MPFGGYRHPLPVLRGVWRRLFCQSYPETSPRHQVDTSASRQWWSGRGLDSVRTVMAYLICIQKQQAANQGDKHQDEYNALAINQAWLFPSGVPMDGMGIWG